jgi:hypothetical protein
MDLRYESYCVADPIVFEPLERLADSAARFPIADRRPPAGWRRTERHVWIGYHPVDIDLPEQGWKIHVSGTPDNAVTVLDTVWEFCVAHSLSFKFLRSIEILRYVNSKNASRASSGKLITIYPQNQQQLDLVLSELAGLLAGTRGPHILSDLRWQDGPLYLRYGAFLSRYCTLPDTDDIVESITGPDGRPVPDVRRPIFQVPPWVDVPARIAEQIAWQAECATGVEFPYLVKSALHFSNGGGVYLATDRVDGRTVVLKEARPFAGLDSNGTDAATRLRAEHAMMERLHDLDIAPRVLGYFTHWEHHYLVLEHIEGTTLHQCIVERHPLIRYRPTEEEVASYTAWATDIAEQVEHAVELLHRRAIAFGDLHTRNVLVRPDNRIALVDFEVCSDVADPRKPGLRAPGFTAPGVRSGVEADRFALACLRLSAYYPLTTLISRDASKARLLAEQTAERFPVPQGFTEQVLHDLTGGTFDPPPSRADFDWLTMRSAIVRSILCSASANRLDRLFPGDIEQFKHGGISFAHGAAGVLYALHRAQVDVDPEHVEWLLRTARTSPLVRSGFYNGLHGVAHTLAVLGRPEEAVELINRASDTAHGVQSLSLFSGHAGMGLNLLHFARETGEARYLGMALATAHRLEDGADRPLPPGLMHGWSGIALFYTDLYAETGDSRFLDDAHRCIERDLTHCTTTADGTLQVVDGSRIVAYLAAGSGGIGLAIHRFLQHRSDPRLHEALEGIRRACSIELVLQPGLFRGRAGFIALLSQTGSGTDDPALQQHVRQLALYTVPHEGGVAFPGEYLLRVSMDLATGSAGVLLAVGAALEKTAFLPFLEMAKTKSGSTHMRGGEGDGLRTELAGSAHR